ncbi:hypothetical protein JTE90_005535 [Oedothorax gibbosus]|uniref:Uncharacterized protein n=1 Tax=Oedothorax gibbosus TaxID=931172 RepID=A0AAV6V957_9ARAC|nr:hypothetical protein JTE90_005535 [Oedothorax gibbosus]
MNLGIVFLVLFSVVGSLGICPPYSQHSPCTCRTITDRIGEDFSILTCEGLQSEDELLGVLEPTRGVPMFELELVNTSLRYIPHDAFKETTYQVLSIRDSRISALSDLDVAFAGLEDHLHLIEVINCSYTSSWDWTQLGNLQHLLEIQVVDSELIDVTKGLASIQHLDMEAFAFHRNNIQRLADEAFAKFTNLERLALDNNFLTEVKRSMFPKPARLLKILGLSYNLLETFPADMFRDMPSLKTLYLTGNPFHTLDEVVFKPVWRQLHLVLFHDTRLSCDCRITWLAQEDNSRKYIHGQCHGPTNFRGRNIHSVQAHELWC